MSVSNKFTPGPWAVINLTGVFSELGAESGDGAKADPTDGWTIADCSAGCTLLNGDYVELGFAVQQANAKLIAAAPDLLEALENLYRDSMASDFNEHWDSFKLAELAILKVRGKS